MPWELVLQTSPTRDTSIATFSGAHKTGGKVGQVHMSPVAESEEQTKSQEETERDPVHELMLADEDKRKAAEVVLGRLDVFALVAGSRAKYKAAEVSSLQLCFIL